MHILSKQNLNAINLICLIGLFLTDNNKNETNKFYSYYIIYANRFNNVWFIASINTKKASEEDGK